MSIALETERLVLSVLTSADAPALFAYRSRPDVCRYQSFAPAILDDAVAFVAKVEADGFDTPGRWFQVGVRMKSSSELVGDIGWCVQQDEPRQVEIGFTIDPAHQRRGFALEAVTRVLTYLFRDLDKHRVVASVDPRNEASMALLARLGMRQEAHFRQSLWFKGSWVDDVVFAVLNADFTPR